MNRRTNRPTLRPLTRRVPLGVEQLEERSLMDASGLIPGLPSNGLLGEPDYQVSISVLPNDSSYGSLYGMSKINAPAAWNVTTGSSKVTVAVIDTGIDYTHADLYRNIWLNQQEIPTAVRGLLTDVNSDGLITFHDLNDARNQGTGKITDRNANGYIDGKDVLMSWADGTDADGNGYRDDLLGWDFANNDNDPFDDNSHGTHVAGTIGAIGNNGLGVTGVNWNVQLAGLKFLGANGSGAISGAIAALNYAVNKGIKISNNSWGGGGYSTTMYNALNNARSQGHLFIAAAGNEGRNNDATPSYPASYNLDNVLSVAATDSNDRLASFSNYGASHVDLAAPGVGILSTTPGNRYSSFSGTSMATPHVAGAVALVMAQNPGLSYSQVLSRIISGVDAVSGLNGKMVTGGRLNVQRALQTTSSPPPADTSGAKVLSAVADSTSRVSSVRLTFSESINASSFTAADITGFAGPAGSALQITSVTAIAGTNNTQFDVTFQAQQQSGNYSFFVGPDILDLAGNRMNQNGNASNGEATDRYQVQYSVVTQTTFTNNSALALPDLSVTRSSITINQDFRISDLNVKFTIQHTYDSDLEISLIGPNGRVVNLVTRRGGSGDNFTDTILDDEATRAIGTGAAPFTGSFRPETALSAYDGMSARGTWYLSISDRARQDIGTLRSWSLIFQGTSSSVAGQSIETDLVSEPDQPKPSAPESLPSQPVVETPLAPPVRTADPVYVAITSPALQTSTLGQTNQSEAIDAPLLAAFLSQSQGADSDEVWSADSPSESSASTASLDDLMRFFAAEEAEETLF